MHLTSHPAAGTGLLLATLMSLAPLAVVAGADTARPLVTPLFSDHMVLQRDRADPIWGWDQPGTAITVTFDGKAVYATADAEGRWRARLPASPAGGPHVLSVTGSTSVAFNDVLVGDVWICSGQSNMEFGIKRTPDAEAEIAKADHPQIRLFVVGKTTALQPVEVLKGTWSTCSPQSVQVGTWDGFSAVGYFFGRELQQNVKIPIGLIQSAWGGSPAQAWTGREALAAAVPEFAAELTALDQASAMRKTGADYRKKLLQDWYGENGVDLAGLPEDFSAWPTMRNLPHNWGAKDDPKLDNFQGAVWFRKEVVLAEDVAGRSAELSLGSLDDGDVTWVNGERVGGEMNLGRRKYQVRAGVLKPGRNVITIWLLNAVGAGGMSSKDPAELALTVKDLPPVPLAGDWRYQIGKPFSALTPRVFQVYDDAGWPTELYNAMIAPLAPFGITGVLWYQGEANVGRGRQYRALLPALISSWRKLWQQGDFPFLVVQLPNFQPPPGARPGENSLAELREAQAMAAARLPKVGVINTIDLGETDLHPKDKLPVGQRAALWARAQVYGEAIAFSGPVHASFAVVDRELRLRWTHGVGLKSKDGQSLRNFAIAGEDRVFHWADARISGDEVVLTSSEVARPVAARYDWDGSPIGNLVNGEGLPAMAFRTDDWVPASP